MDRDTARDRGLDEMAVVVQDRLDAVVDLFTADAVYHLRCHVRFSNKLPHMPSKRKRGQPINAAAEAAFEMLCTTLEQECENDLYTLDELHGMMHQLAGCENGSEFYGLDYFKEILVERSGTHINVASHYG